MAAMMPSSPNPSSSLHPGFIPARHNFDHTGANLADEYVRTEWFRMIDQRLVEMMLDGRETMSNRS